MGNFGGCDLVPHRHDQDALPSSGGILQSGWFQWHLPWVGSSCSGLCPRCCPLFLHLRGSEANVLITFLRQSTCCYSRGCIFYWRVCGVLGESADGSREAANANGAIW